MPLYRGVGRALAQLHQASNDFRSAFPRRPLDPFGSLDQALDVVLARLTGRPEERTFLRQLAVRARERLVALATQGLEWGVCHGDVSLDNLHVHPGGRITFYDFDSAGPGWRASDPYGVPTWLTRGKPEYSDAFLAGYEAVRPLGEADRQAFPWFVPVQMLDNLRWRLTDWLGYRGTLSLDAGYIDNVRAALRRWDQAVLGGPAVPR
ncbi:MAG: phosphotransferase [Chloroflexi bacterium]|nr:phosphotransferase [Chloroflexota bacterium]